VGISHGTGNEGWDICIASIAVRMIQPVEVI